MNSDDEGNDDGMAEMEFIFESIDYVSTLKPEPPEGHPPEIKNEPLADVPVKKEEFWEDGYEENKESESVSIQEHKVDIQLLQQDLHQGDRKEKNIATRGEELPSKSEPKLLHEQVFGDGISYEEAMQKAWKLLEETSYLSDDDYSDTAPKRQVADSSLEQRCSSEEREKNADPISQKQRNSLKVGDTSLKQESPTDGRENNAQEQQNFSKQRKKNTHDQFQRQQSTSEKRNRISCDRSQKLQRSAEESIKNARDISQKQQSPSEEREKNECGISEEQQNFSKECKKNACISSQNQQGTSRKRIDGSQERKNNSFPECGRVSRSPHYLEMDNLSHTQSKLKCIVCAKHFSSRESRDEHVQNHFERNPPVSSNNDPLPLPGKTKRKSTDTVSSGVTPSKVPCSNAKFNRNNNDLQKQMCEGSQGTIWICEICKVPGIDRNKYVQHLHSHIEKNQTVCPICMEAFETKLKLSYHVHSHTRGVSQHKPASSAPASNEEPATKSNKHPGDEDLLRMRMSCLLQHVAPHNPDSKDKISSVKKLKAEKEKNTASKREKQRGVQSGSGVIRKSPVQSPLSRELFKCDRCPREFKYRSDWLRHLKSRHSDRNSKVLSIKEFRGKETQGRSSLKDEGQCKEEQGGMQSSSDVIPVSSTQSGLLEGIQCTKCPRKFTNEGNLARNFSMQHSETRSKASSMRKVKGKDFGMKSANDESSTSHIEAPVLRQIECTKCPRKFTNKGNFVQHFSAAHSDSKSKASAVKMMKAKRKQKGSSLKDEESVGSASSRSSIESNALKRIKCTKCSRDFPNEASLVRHFSIQHTKTKSKTSSIKMVKGKEFGIESANSESSTSCIESPVLKKIECTKCPRKFTNKGSFVQHFSAAHSPVLKLIECTKCHRKFPSKANLGRHFSVKHCESKSKASSIKMVKAKEGGIKSVNGASPGSCSDSQALKRIKCTKCPREFPNKASLVRHFSARHSDSKGKDCLIKVMKGKECGEKSVNGAFRTSCSESQVLKRIKCSKCPREFLNVRCLGRHISVKHSGSKFNSSSVKQMKAKKKQNGSSLQGKAEGWLRYQVVTILKCTKCHGEFKNMGHWLQHFQTHHADSERKSPSSKKIEAKVIREGSSVKAISCKMGASNKASSKISIKSYDFKRHQCTMCPQRFTQKCNMLRHIKTEHSHSKQKNSSIKLMDNQQKQENPVADKETGLQLGCSSVPRSNCSTPDITNQKESQSDDCSGMTDPHSSAVLQSGNRSHPLITCRIQSNCSRNSSTSSTLKSADISILDIDGELLSSGSTSPPSDKELKSDNVLNPHACGILLPGNNSNHPTSTELQSNKSQTPPTCSTLQPAGEQKEDSDSVLLPSGSSSCLHSDKELQSGGSSSPHSDKELQSDNGLNPTACGILLAGNNSSSHASTDLESDYRQFPPICSTFKPAGEQKEDSDSVLLPSGSSSCLHSDKELQSGGSSSPHSDKELQSDNDVDPPACGILLTGNNSNSHTSTDLESDYRQIPPICSTLQSAGEQKEDSDSVLLPSGSSSCLHSDKELQFGGSSSPHSDKELQSDNGLNPTACGILLAGNNSSSHASTDLESDYRQFPPICSTLKPAGEQKEDSDSVLLPSGSSSCLHSDKELQSGRSSSPHSDKELQSDNDVDPPACGILLAGNNSNSHTSTDLESDYRQIPPICSTLKPAGEQKEDSDSVLLPSGSSSCLHSDKELQSGGSSSPHSDKELQSDNGLNPTACEILLAGNNSNSHTSTDLESDYCQIPPICSTLQLAGEQKGDSDSVLLPSGSSSCLHIDKELQSGGSSSPQSDKELRSDNDVDLPTCGILLAGDNSNSPTSTHLESDYRQIPPICSTLQPACEEKEDSDSVLLPSGSRSCLHSDTELQSDNGLNPTACGILLAGNNSNSHASTDLESDYCQIPPICSTLQLAGEQKGDSDSVLLPSGSSSCLHIDKELQSGGSSSPHCDKELQSENGVDPPACGILLAGNNSNSPTSTNSESDYRQIPPICSTLQPAGEQKEDSDSVLLPSGSSSCLHSGKELQSEGSSSPQSDKELQSVNGVDPPPCVILLSGNNSNSHSSTDLASDYCQIPPICSTLQLAGEQKGDSDSVLLPSGSSSCLHIDKELQSGGSSSPQSDKELRSDNDVDLPTCGILLAGDNSNSPTSTDLESDYRQFPPICSTLKPAGEQKEDSDSVLLPSGSSSCLHSDKELQSGGSSSPHSDKELQSDNDVDPPACGILLAGNNSNSHTSTDLESDYRQIPPICCTLKPAGEQKEDSDSVLLPSGSSSCLYKDKELQSGGSSSPHSDKELQSDNDVDPPACGILLAGNNSNSHTSTDLESDYRQIPPICSTLQSAGEQKEDSDSVLLPSGSSSCLHSDKELQSGGSSSPHSDKELQSDNGLNPIACGILLAGNNSNSLTSTDLESDYRQIPPICSTLQSAGEQKEDSDSVLLPSGSSSCLHSDKELQSGGSSSPNSDKELQSDNGLNPTACGILLAGNNSSSHASTDLESDYRQIPPICSTLQSAGEQKEDSDSVLLPSGSSSCLHSDKELQSDNDVYPPALGILLSGNNSNSHTSTDLESDYRQIPPICSTLKPAGEQKEDSGSVLLPSGSSSCLHSDKELQSGGSSSPQSDKELQSDNGLNPTACWILLSGNNSYSHSSTDLASNYCQIPPICSTLQLAGEQKGDSDSVLLPSGSSSCLHIDKELQSGGSSSPHYDKELQSDNDVDPPACGILLPGNNSNSHSSTDVESDYRQIPPVCSTLQSAGEQKEDSDSVLLPSGSSSCLHIDKELQSGGSSSPQSDKELRSDNDVDPPACGILLAGDNSNSPTSTDLESDYRQIPPICSTLQPACEEEGDSNSVLLPSGSRSCLHSDKELQSDNGLNPTACGILLAGNNSNSHASTDLESDYCQIPPICSTLQLAGEQKGDSDSVLLPSGSSSCMHIDKELQSGGSSSPHCDKELQSENGVDPPACGILLAGNNSNSPTSTNSESDYRQIPPICSTLQPAGEQKEDSDSVLLPSGSSSCLHSDKELQSGGSSSPQSDKELQSDNDVYPPALGILLSGNNSNSHTSTDLESDYRQIPPICSTLQPTGEQKEDSDSVLLPSGSSSCLHSDKELQSGGSSSPHSD